MTNHFIATNGKLKRFSIDDAFEEETDEAIKVYGSTIPRSPVSSSSIASQSDLNGVRVDNGRGYKLTTDTSRDSDSLIQDYYESSSREYWDSSCFNHPKVRENWRMVLAAATLLIIGIGLLATAIATFISPSSSLQGAVFLLAGLICFIPGAYHVVYIYLAAKGKRGYHFHNLPLFT
ncbi:hypothetical protein WA026_002513 [Henosepilachna vigintioctopunctata]|uniref:Transmembrane protein 134 n=1 Tax=Henosepilachna vigintioctopunctata TaxID=420089 RepID=A0AAW1U1C3_9CUCU